LITIGQQYLDTFNALAIGDKRIYAVGETVVDPSNSYDILVASFSLNGSLLWVKSFGGEKEDRALDIAIAGDTIVVVGYTLSFKVSRIDAFVMALSLQGDLKWFKVFGGKLWDEARAVYIRDNKIYVVGLTNSFGQKLEGFLAIFSIDGNLEKFITVGGEDWDELRCISGSDSVIYVAGLTKSFGESLDDVLLAAFDTEGSFLWAKTLGGRAGDLVSDILVEKDALYLVGYTESFASGDDAFIAALAPSGELMWCTLIYGEDIDSAKAIDIEHSKIYVAGYTKSYGEKGCDIFLAALDLSGRLLSFQTVGKKYSAGLSTKVDEIAEDMKIKNGVAYLVGSLNSFGEGSSEAFLLVENVDKLFEKTKKSLTFAGNEAQGVIISHYFPSWAKVNMEVKSIVDKISVKDYTGEVVSKEVSPKISNPILKTHIAYLKCYVQILSDKVNYKTGYYREGQVLELKAKSPIYFGNKTRLVLMGWYVEETFIKDKVLFLVVDKDLVIKPVYRKEYYVEVRSNFSKVSSGWYPVLTPLVLEAEPEVVLDNKTKLVHIGWKIGEKIKEVKLAQLVVRKPLVIEPIYERYYLVTIVLKHDTKELWIKENSTVKLPEIDDIFENLIKYSLKAFKDQYGREYKPGTVVKITEPLVFKAEYHEDYTIPLIIAAVVVMVIIIVLASALKRAKKKT